MAENTKKYLDENGLIRFLANIIDKFSSKDHEHVLADVTDVTATAKEVNVLDGITATTAELNYMDGVTSNVQSQIDSLSSTKANKTDLTSGTVTVKEAERATSADTATKADTATNADHAETADSATKADTATNATNAEHAETADEATHATSADSATTAATSTKAIQDGSGNIITSTYETISSADAREDELKELISGKADASHTHTIANITNLQSTLDSKASSSHSHSAATTTAAGFMSAADKEKLDGIAAGANNYTYTLPSAGSSLGGVKSGGDVTISAGTITVNDDSHNHVISNVDGLQSALDGKAAASHTHDDLYYTEDEIDSKVATLESSIAGKAASSHSHAIADVTNLQSSLDAKVPTSRTVNGKALTSNITLSASDVSAYSKSEIDSKVSTLNSAISGKEDSGTAASAVSAHNTATDAHNDIRDLIDGLTTRLNALANSTDEDLDQMAEIVAYIKSNKTLIDSITTSKVNVSDIVNNLTTNVTNKPLSAAQGVAIKSLIDTLQGEVDTNESNISSHTGNKSNPHGVTLAQLGVTATAAEVNIMDGVTATTAEINKLDGVTATTAEINYLDGVTSAIQSQLDSKAASGHTHSNYASTVSTTGSGNAITAISQSGNTITATKGSTFSLSSHTHNYAGSSSAGGVANSAAKLETARTISLTGDAAGSASFDGSGDASISTSVTSMHGVTTAGDGAAYTATVSGITSLTAGVSFIMIPHTNSTTTTPTLNVNSLGAKGIRMRGSSATGTAMTAAITAWLASGRPVQVTYNGIYWLAEVTRPSASDLSGTVAVANGGTGAADAATARTNLGALSSADGAVGTSNIADGAVTAAKLDPSLGLVSVSSTEPTDEQVFIWIEV